MKEDKRIYLKSHGGSTCPGDSHSYNENGLLSKQSRSWTIKVGIGNFWNYF